MHLTNLYEETIKILEKNDKSLDDIETVVLIDKIYPENSCTIPKKDYIRLSKKINYNSGFGTGKKIDSGLMLLGKDFRIIRREYDSAEYFEFINYKVEIPEKINKNAKIWWE